jgi:hypothetical protein
MKLKQFDRNIFQANSLPSSVKHGPSADIIRLNGDSRSQLNDMLLLNKEELTS